MRETTGRHGRVSTKLKAAVVGVLAIFAFGAFSATSANAAQGDPFAVDFNYVGLNVGVSIVGEVNEIVLTPDSVDGEGNPLGDLSVTGTYTDNAGNFNVPQATGLDFPDVEVDLGDGIVIDGSIGLTDDATGNYNAATGAMTMNPKISLTLGTTDISALPEPVGSLGSGPLECEFAPLDVQLSTNPTNWPAPGQVFTDKENLTGGALAGAWDIKPKVNAIAGGQLCTIIGGFLDPVGGLYLANSADPITSMPAPTGAKPAARPCPAGTTGEPGTPPEDCIVDEVPVCVPPQTGTPPNCQDPVLPPPVKKANFSKVAVSGPGAIKAGKSVKLTVKVTNSGDAAGSVKVAIKSTNKQVKAPKTVSVSVPAGKTVSKKITVKAGKKAKGKATITAKAGSKSGKKVLKVKAAKKKK